LDVIVGPALTFFSICFKAPPAALRIMSRQEGTAAAVFLLKLGLGQPIADLRAD
jgi:hypothetical protein